MTGELIYTTPDLEFPGRNDKIEDISGKIRNWFIEITKLNPEKDLIHEFLEASVESQNGRIVSNSAFRENVNTDGSMIVHPDGSFEIFLSPFTGPTRDVFTIAHELGHYFLHYFFHKEKYNNQLLKFNRHGKGILETQANRFAASFLMPMDIFEKKAKEFDRDLRLLSSYFQVSISTTKIRLEHIK